MMTNVGYGTCGTCHSRLPIGGRGMTHYYVPVDGERLMRAISAALDAVDCAQARIAHPKVSGVNKRDALDLLEGTRADLEAMEQGELAFQVSAAASQDDSRIISADAARGIYDLLALFVLDREDAADDIKRLARSYQLALDTTRFMEEMHAALEDGVSFNLAHHLPD